MSLLPADAFDDIFYLSAEVSADEDRVVIALELAFDGELVLSPAGDAVAALVLGSTNAGMTAIRAIVTLGAEPSVLLEEVAVALRLREDVLRDVDSDGPAAIAVTADVRISADDVVVEDLEGASLAPAYVADTEMIVEADDVRIVLGPVGAPGWLAAPEDFRGLAIDRLSLTLPAEYVESESGAELRIAVEEAAIGTGGFTGKASVSAATVERPFEGRLFGHPFRFRTFELDIERNDVRMARLAVDVRLTALEQDDTPFWVGIDVGLAAGRVLTGALSAAQPPEASDHPTHLVSFAVAGAARVGISAIAVSVDDGVVLTCAGTLTILFGDGALSWPTIAFDGLGVDDDGQLVTPSGGVRLQGVARAALGPLALHVADAGLGSDEDGGLSLTPPAEIGVAIDAGPVVGTGTLRFDRERGEYGGSAQLRIDEIGVHAAVIVATGGPERISVLVMITAEGFTPVSLGFGFVLTDVGGLLAFNRTVAVEALRTGLRERTLDAILFPKDPVRNAGTVLRTLRRVFPPRDGGVLLGPMALITWGVPPLLTVKLAAIIELSTPVRLVVLAQLRAALPSTDRALVLVNMDAVGVLNVDEGTLAVDAVLYDSHVLGAAISGEMALRARWRTDPTFVMAIGGFNTRFPVPAGFPRLRRVQVQLTSGDNPRVRLEAYLALTSNTVQLGADLDLHVRAAGFSIDGDLGFDALITISPFELTADMRAGVTLKWRGRTLLSVTLHMTLTGPTPWHVSGKATFKVWKFSKSVRFDKTFGRADAPPLPPPADPLTPLIAAVTDRRSWATQLPGGGDTLLRLTDAAAAGDAEVLVHPLGTVTLRQRVVPLDVPIDTFGARRISGDTTFTVTAAPTAQTTVSTRSVRDHFAPAQFFAMDDTARLAAPSFELMDAGLELSGDAVRYGGQRPGESGLMVESTASYDTCIMLADGSCHEPPGPYEPPSAHLPDMVAIGPAARAPVRTTGDARFRAPAVAVEVLAPSWTAATTATLEAVPVSERDTTYTAVRLALAQRLADHPEERDELQLVPRAEALGSAP